MTLSIWFNQTAVNESAHDEPALKGRPRPSRRS